MWIILLIVILLVAIWEFWICEGAHLGRRFVVCLYDLAAFRYEKIKGFDPAWERSFLGEPIAAVASGFARAHLLDVGAGTGRIARTVYPLPSFNGWITSLEPSKRMILRGQQLSPSESTTWVRGWAFPLPFADHSFDIVISLETLEFTPKPLNTLTEMIRVLRPGGWLLVTNRIDWEARWIIGRTFTREAFPRILKDLGLQSVNVFPWQVTYDLAWARKPAIYPP
jgi:ubiquinone/menaquinone biosynthesis C-methylase UbiE